MMARIVINGRAYDDMVIETGYPVTLLTPDQAARCGLQVLSDTLLVNSMFGPLKVRPALARSICLGEVELTDVPVYVATADNPSLAPGFSGLIGTSALARIGVVDIEAERLVFPIARLRRSLTQRPRCACPHTAAICWWAYGVMRPAELIAVLRSIPGRAAASSPRSAIRGQLLTSAVWPCAWERMRYVCLMLN